MDLSTLFDLILSANFLNIASLLDITCAAVAEQIKGKSPEQIRETFGIEVRLHTQRSIPSPAVLCSNAASLL